MATLPVKWYHSMMRGIPLIAGVKGRLKLFLDAVLVNGFGQITINSVTISNKIATIVIPNSETFLKYSVIEISGDDQLKGEYRVIESTNSYIKINVDLPDQVFSSSMFVKYASLGWSKQEPTTAVNTCLYIPKTSHSNFKLYVNDNYDSAAFVKICKGASNMENLANYGADQLIDHVPKSGNLYSCWFKSYTTGAEARANFLIGDGSSIFYQWCRTEVVNNYDSLQHGKIMFCGDILRAYPGDPNAAVLMCAYTTNPNSISSTYFGDSMALKSTLNVNYHNTGNNIYKTFLGNVFGDSMNEFAGRVQDGATICDWSAWGGTAMDQSLIGGIELFRMKAVTERVIRGEYPGILFSGTSLEGMSDLVIEEGSGDMAGRLIMFKKSSSASGPYEYGDPVCVAYDITGPWR
ncbi:MAG: hypothetical protein RR877_00165 [Aurantimicrobium sp.]|uniref:hypothetical protein n=1 Tax=Aurantimicrobium sp. TaxID=1930784 RepID=UPI002FC5F49F